MSEVSALRSLYGFVHMVMEGTMGDVTPEQAHWIPPGKANPIGAMYAHAVFAEDVMIQGMARGAAPLCAGEWGAKAGVSSPPPMEGGDWGNWGREAKVDLDKLRAFAQAVYANTDAYFATLSDADLQRKIDLSAFNSGEQTVGWFLFNVVGTHGANTTGDISALKGVQGAKGYPF